MLSDVLIAKFGRWPADPNSTLMLYSSESRGAGRSVSVNVSFCDLCVFFIVNYAQKGGLSDPYPLPSNCLLGMPNLCGLAIGSRKSSLGTGGGAAHWVERKVVPLLRVGAQGEHPEN